jgi:hypothetical protein
MSENLGRLPKYRSGLVDTYEPYQKNTGESENVKMSSLVPFLHSESSF